MAYRGESHKLYMREWRRRVSRPQKPHKRYPDERSKDIAWNKLEYQLRLGTIVRPQSCQKCGVIPPKSRSGASQIQAHHPDYTKPLEVEWLCPPCHGETRWQENQRAAPKPEGKESP
jgi:hypothetical protein